jgi:hypothetical protein
MYGSGVEVTVAQTRSSMKLIHNPVRRACATCGEFDLTKKRGDTCRRRATELARVHRTVTLPVTGEIE